MGHGWVRVFEQLDIQSEGGIVVGRATIHGGRFWLSPLVRGRLFAPTTTTILLVWLGVASIKVSPNCG